MSGKDQGHSWVALLGVALGYAVTDGLYFSFGILFSKLATVFLNEKRLVLSVLACLFHGLPLLQTPLAWLVSKKLGCRRLLCISSVLLAAGYITLYFTHQLWHLFVIFSIVLPLGLSAVYVCCADAVNQYFIRYKGFAFGVCGSAGGLGMTAAPVLLHLLISTFSWQGAALITGALTLHLLVSASLMWSPSNVDQTPTLPPAPPLTRKSTGPASSDLYASVISIRDLFQSSASLRSLYTPDSTPSRADETAPFLQRASASIELKEKSTDSGICRTSAILYLISCLIGSVSMPLVWTYLPDALRLAGSSNLKAAILVSFWGLATTLGHLPLSWLADRTDAMVTDCMCHVIMASSFILMPFVLDSFGPMLALCLLGGFGMCSRYGPTNVALLANAGERVSTVSAVQQVACGIGLCIGAPLMGLIFDHFQSYKLAFHMAGGCLMISAMLKFVAFLLQQNLSKTRRQLEEEITSLEMEQLS